MAELALHTETDELGISAGFQDRYVIAFEGVVYMDFTGKEHLREDDPYGKVERLVVDEIPFFLALGMKPKSSAIFHNPLRERFLQGDKVVKEYMDRIADLALQGKEYLLNGDWTRLGELMNKNTQLRNEVSPPIKKDQEMIEMALRYGALGAKVAGSGGAVIILTEDEDIRNKMIKKCGIYQPKIALPETKEE